MSRPVRVLDVEIPCPQILGANLTEHTPSGISDRHAHLPRRIFGTMRPSSAPFGRDTEQVIRNAGLCTSGATDPLASRISS
jgi:hypothetical protein